MFEYKATYLSNYDGDTIDFDVALGFDIYYKITVRLFGVDTKELRGTAGKEKSQAVKAKKFVSKSLKNANEIIVKTIKDKKGKYGRYLAEVVFDGKNLNKLLVEKNLAIRKIY